MSEQLRRQIIREFPELQSGYHLPVLAKISAIIDAPESSGVNCNYRPRIAANVKLLNSHFEETGVELEAVPFSSAAIGTERGIFAMPEKETLVEMAWLNGSPELPFIRSQLGYKKILPELEAAEMAWQKDNENGQRIDAAGNHNRKTEGEILDNAHTIKQHAQELAQEVLNQTLRALGNSIEDIDGEKRIEATAANILSATIINMLAAGSINQTAGKSITRSAGEQIHETAELEIIHQTKTSYQLEAGEDIEATAVGNMTLTAEKLHIGAAINLLEIVSDAMQACIDGFTAAAAATVTCSSPGNPSSPPLNAPQFASAASAITAAKAKVDAMTL